MFHVRQVRCFPMDGVIKKNNKKIRTERLDLSFQGDIRRSRLNATVISLTRRPATNYSNLPVPVIKIKQNGGNK